MSSRRLAGAVVVALALALFSSAQPALAQLPDGHGVHNGFEPHRPKGCKGEVCLK